MNLSFKVIDPRNGKVLEVEDGYAIMDDWVVLEDDEFYGYETSHIKYSLDPKKSIKPIATPSITIDDVEYSVGDVFEFEEGMDKNNKFIILCDGFGFCYKWEGWTKESDYMPLKGLIRVGSFKKLGNVWMPEYLEYKNLLEV